MQIRVDHEFRSLIPPLSADELKQLEANLASEGCREPLVVWNGTLLDGHNRKSICERLNIPFTTSSIELSDRTAAKEWIIRNQLGRRNLSKLDRIALVRLLEPIERERAKERQRAAGGDRKAVQAKLPEPEDGQSRDHLAKLAGVSGKTYEAGVRVLEKGTPALQQAVRENVCSVSAAATLSKAEPQAQDKAVADGKLGIMKATQRVRGIEHAERQRHVDEGASANGKLKGIGVFQANEAVNCLIRIPKDDPLRKRGFQIVTDWIKANR